MSKAVPRAKIASAFWTKVVAACLLICHITSATAIVPFVVMTLAAVDGSHAVTVECSGAGAGVRLHHRAGDFTPCLRDHHSLAGRLAATLCGAAKTDGDHVLAASANSLNTEIKKRDDLAGDARSVPSSAEAVSFETISIHKAARPAFPLTLAAEFDARVHALHAHSRVLSTVVLLV